VGSSRPGPGRFPVDPPGLPGGDCSTSLTRDQHDLSFPRDRDAAPDCRLGPLSLCGTRIARDARAARRQQALPTGRVTGRIVDAATGQGLSDVGVQIVGTTIGAQSGVDGRFTVSKVPAGTVTIQARRIGYQAKTVTGIVLVADGAVAQDISLAPASVQLTADRRHRVVERGTVSAALDPAAHGDRHRERGDVRADRAQPRLRRRRRRSSA
jgi:hypothetical protein